MEYVSCINTNIRVIFIYFINRFEEMRSKTGNLYYVINPSAHKTAKHGMRATIVLSPKDKDHLAVLVAYAAKVICLFSSV